MRKRRKSNFKLRAMTIFEQKVFKTTVVVQSARISAKKAPLFSVMLSISKCKKRSITWVVFCLEINCQQKKAFPLNCSFTKNTQLSKICRFQSRLLEIWNRCHDNQTGFHGDRSTSKKIGFKWRSLLYMNSLYFRAWNKRVSSVVRLRR